MGSRAQSRQKSKKSEVGEDVALSLIDAESISEALAMAIRQVIDASAVDLDYGNTEKMGREMEVLHRLRLAEQTIDEAIGGEARAAAE